MTKKNYNNTIEPIFSANGIAIIITTQHELVKELYIEYIFNSCKTLAPAFLTSVDISGIKYWFFNTYFFIIILLYYNKNTIIKIL